MSELHCIARSARSISLRLAVTGARYFLPAPADWVLEKGGEPIASGHATTAVLAIHDLRPDTEYHIAVTGFAPFKFRTAPCAGLIDIADFGARQDAADNSSAIAAAIEAVPPGGTLRVSSGIWWTRPVFLKSDMTLELCAGAELRAVGARGGWVKLPAHDEAGRMLGSWEGLPETCFAALVTAIDAQNLVIAGPGTIDGGGDRGDWWSWPKETRDGARRPRTIHLIGCKNVTLLGPTICNSPSWTVHPQGCASLTATALTIDNPTVSPNTDGLNPESCEGVLIEGVRFSVGDDCIAIKSGKRDMRGNGDHLAPTRDVTIRHCLMERGHGGVVLGSEMSGGIHDITVEDCEMRDTDRGLRVKTRRGRGGEVSTIRFRRVSMKGVYAAVTLNAFYFCDPDGHDEWVQSRCPAAVSDLTPQIRDIRIEDVQIADLHLVAVAALGLPEAPIRDISIRNLAVSYAADAKPGPALMAERVPDLRHAGIVAEWVQIDVDHSNITMTTESFEGAAQ
ncbi:glycoside hydrolase family 28 protein (plasmid) [Qingshengfaniella alkalisoli]|uniref:Glycoside hydrolase family 28 protein n=2 Tax=Qingshengfaniella alkalisoli TaxID=2599296 RepID=A0A5B8I9M9_9RHOB|nr:glycoside hydrolase family 28 protein [Qingshengfaniella alkalisoli]